MTESYSRSELSKWLRHNPGIIVEQEYWQFWDGDMWTVGNQVVPPERVSSAQKASINVHSHSEDFVTERIKSLPVGTAGSLM